MFKINWLSLEETEVPNPTNLLDMEYDLQLQVVMILIKESEHLMDYLSLIVMDIDPNEGLIIINEDTPEPLYSIIKSNLTHPDFILTDEFLGSPTVIQTLAR